MAILGGVLEVAKYKLTVVRNNGMVARELPLGPAK
jgi:hypothetical protein